MHSNYAVHYFFVLSDSPHHKPLAILLQWLGL